jgi:predicted site-specific integrase-resolvase
MRDIGSGLNFKRKGLVSLLHDVADGRVEEIVVASRDRMARFGFELIEWICNKYATKLVVLEQNDDTSPESELATDLMSIINVFCCRRNGRRRYRESRNEGGTSVAEIKDQCESGVSNAHETVDG